MAEQCYKFGVETETQRLAADSEVKTYDEFDSIVVYRDSERPCDRATGAAEFDAHLKYW